MEEILRVILRDKDLKVIEVIPQNSIKNLQGRSVRLDALCIRGDGRPCNIEVEKSNNKHHLKRVRYNASCITANIVDNGLHEVYVNTAVKDDSEVSELMQCFLQTEVDNGKFPKLSQRVKYLKHNEEGVKSMCEIADEIREEERIDAITRMLRKWTIDDVVDLGYDRAYVMQIANSR